MDIELGNFAEAIGALGTLAAFGFGVLVYRDEIHRRSMEQASKVAAWWATYNVPADREGTARYKLHNGSDAPVYDVSIGLVDWDGHTRLYGRRYHVLTPNVTVDQGGETDDDEFIVPPPPDAERWPQGPFMELSFTDNSGQRWKRTARGRLERVG